MMKIIVLVLLLFAFSQIDAQTYPCEKSGVEVIAKMIGKWQVETKDRTSPGNYESNKGTAEITWGVGGCSIHEVYKGVFKSHPYAVEYVTYLNDSVSIQRTFYDSEHSNLMWFNGDIQPKTIHSIWYRDLEKKRMQVKNEIKIVNQNSFENITHLSTDYGKTWALTHHWVYSR